MALGVDSGSNRNRYVEYFLRSKSGRCVGLTTLIPSCADSLESGSLNFLEPSGPIQACNRIVFIYFIEPKAEKKNCMPTVYFLGHFSNHHDDAPTCPNYRKGIQHKAAQNHKQPGGFRKVQMPPSPRTAVHSLSLPQFSK